MRQNRVKHVFRIAVVILVIAAALTSYGCKRELPEDWEIYNFQSSSNPYGVSFLTGQKSYNPNKTKFVTAILTNTGCEEVRVGASFTLVKKIGNVWKVVPMDTVFPKYMAYLCIGGTHSYTVSPEMLEVTVTSGTFRLVTTVYIVTTIVHDDFKHGKSWTEEVVTCQEAFAEFKLK